jgi:hypothetical protein
VDAATPGRIGLGVVGAEVGSPTFVSEQGGVGYERGDLQVGRRLCVRVGQVGDQVPEVVAAALNTHLVVEGCAEGRFDGGAR